MHGITDNLQALGGFYARKEMAAMLGRPLASVTLSPSKDRITFAFADGGRQAFKVVGDCCSTSWIEHLELPAGDIEGAVISDVSESMMERDDPAGIKECLKVYRTTFVTDRGAIDLEYRNSSNGYYGGWLEAAG